MVRQPTSRDDEGPSADEPVPGYAASGVDRNEHRWELQIMMQLSKDMGALSAKTDTLIADVKGHGDKIDDLRNQAAFTKGAIAASTVFITIAIGLATFFLSQQWDAAIKALATFKSAAG